MRFSLAWTLLLISGGSAAAADVRVLWGDGSVVTSDCIGSEGDIHQMAQSTKSIQCMIDTYAACELLQYSQLSPDWKGPTDMRRICDSLPPGGRSIADGLAPIPLRDFYYSYDVWQLREADFPQEPYPITELSDAIPGDSVVDFFVLSCAPQLDCLQQFHNDTPTSQLRKHCPRTDCDDWTASDEEYVVPYMTFIFRKNGETWKEVGTYHDRGRPRHTENWRPDHWKRK